jgi:nitrogen fixation NifU-like protein
LKAYETFRHWRINDQSQSEVSTTCFSGWVKDPTLTYSETFRDHVANPRNAGELPDATSVAEETNPVCGDRLRLSLRICNGRIEAARFLAYGCPATLACGSALAEMIERLTLDQAMEVTRSDIVDAVGGLARGKQHAAALAIETLQKAIHNLHDQSAPNI